LDRGFSLEPKSSQIYIKKGVGEDQNKYVRFASKISDNNLEFIATLQGENSLWTPDRKHRDGHGWGFCGFDDRWWGKIINDPRFFNDPEWQLNQCWEKFQGGTRFYARDRWKERAVYFELINQ